MSNLNENDEFEDYPLANSLDNAILMHRDAHFGGKFDVMLDYYEKNGKGAQEEFDFGRIGELALMEKRTQQNLAALMLTGPEAEKVARAKEAYKNLRDLYNQKNPKNKIPLLIADLILSEEEEPENEIQALINEKNSLIPLIELLRSEEFHDPLFPGYGQAPILAAKCLSKIGDKRAIIALFEAIGTESFFDEDIILQGLKTIGNPAKEFLLKVVHGKPLNEDNEKAAIALINFKEDPEVAEACLKMLEQPEVRKHIPLATYLILVCEGLTDSQLQSKFLALAQDSCTPKALQQDFSSVSKTWDNR